MPGLGNPLEDLDIDDFNEFLARVSFVSKANRGELTDRDILNYESGLIG